MDEKLKKQIENNLFLELETRLSKFEERIAKLEYEIDELKKI